MEASCALRLCIAQLHSSDVAFDAHARSYRVAGATFFRVQVMGVCVKRNNAQLKLDDGSGLLDVKMLPNVRGVDQQKIQLGALVECVGSIEEPWPPSDMTRSRRWMNATHVHDVQDRNIETLRMLEIIHLYRNDYSMPHASPPTALELLAFPQIENGSSGQAAAPSLEDDPATSQHANNHRDIQSSSTNTLIEKPWEQRSAGASLLESGIPPEDYHFSLPDRDHTLIQQGVKTLEIRLNVTPYSIIHVNDRITINGTTLTTVAAVRKYSRLQSALEAENVNALLPQSSFVGGSTFNASAAAERHYRQFFSADEEVQYGLVVFELAVATPASSAPKSQEEWSALVCRQLEVKSDVGCSIADLRFSFPTLPVDQITEILTNLQFDALVVHINGKYRLV